MASGSGSISATPQADHEYWMLYFINYAKANVFKTFQAPISKADFQAAHVALKILTSGEGDLANAISGIGSQSLQDRITSLAKTCSKKSSGFHISNFLPPDQWRGKKPSEQEIRELNTSFLEGTLAALAGYLPKDIARGCLSTIFAEIREPSSRSPVNDEAKLRLMVNVNAPVWMKELVWHANQGVFNKLCENWDYIQRTFSLELLNPIVEGAGGQFTPQHSELVKKLVSAAENPSKFDQFLHEWPCSAAEFINMPSAESELNLILFVMCSHREGVSIKEIIESFPANLREFLVKAHDEQDRQWGAQDSDQSSGVFERHLNGVQPIFVGLANLLNYGLDVELLARLSQEEPKKLEMLLLYATDKCCQCYKNMKDLLAYNINHLAVILRGFAGIQPLADRIGLKDILACIPAKENVDNLQVDGLLTILVRSYLPPLLDRNISLIEILRVQPTQWHRLVEEQVLRLGDRAFKRAVNKYDVTRILTLAFPEYLKTIKL